MRLGRLSSKTTPNGASLSYGYDSAGRMTTEAGVSYSYDSAGALTNDGVQAFAYDDFGRRETATDLATGVVLSYAYDKRGLRTFMEVGEWMEVYYAYDDASRLITVAKDMDDPAEYDYDAGGRRTKLTLPNGVETAYTYDSADRLTDLATTGPLGTLASFSYTHDPIGMPSA